MRRRAVQLSRARPRTQPSPPSGFAGRRPGATGCFPSVPLIAGGTTFPLPSLTDVPTSLDLIAGDGGAAKLATILLRDGTADAADWRDGGNAVEFLAAMLDRVILQAGADEANKEFPMDICLSDCIVPVYDSRPVTNPDILYLTAEPTAAGYCVIGPALKALEEVDPRLPVTFYDRMHAAIGKAVRYYDFRDALERVDHLHECYEEDEQGVEFPDVEGAIPTSTGQSRLSRAAVRQLFEKTPPGAAQTLLRRLFDLEKAASRISMPELSEEERERLSDCNPCLPSLLTVFNRHDAIEGCFDDEMQYAQECPPEPAVIIPFRPGDLRSVRGAFRLLVQFCRFMRAIAQLLSAVPGNATKYD